MYLWKEAPLTFAGVSPLDDGVHKVKTSIKGMWTVLHFSIYCTPVWQIRGTIESSSQTASWTMAEN